jgi:hypothetical protein
MQNSNMDLADEVGPAKFYPSRSARLREPFQGENWKVKCKTEYGCERYL